MLRPKTGCSVAGALVVLVGIAASQPVLHGAGVDVFTHGDGGYPCLRIPSLVTAAQPGKPGPLVAIMECRRNCGDECWPSALWPRCATPLRGAMAGDVCMRRSEDGGRTWEPLQVLAPNGRSPTGFYDRGTGATVVVYANYTTFAMGLLTSLDGGKSWTQPRWLDQAAGPANHSASQPGIGIQLQGGRHAGRLLWTVWSQQVGGKEGGPLRVMFSDDNMRTLHSKTVPGNGPGGHVAGSEAHLVELGPDELLIVIRGGVWAGLPDPSSSVCGCKGCDCSATARSHDGGTSWTAAKPNPTMPNPGCMSGLVHATDGCNYLSNPGTQFAHDPDDLTDPVHAGWCHGPRTASGVTIPGMYSKCGRFNGVISRSGDGVDWKPALNVTVGVQFGYSALTQINGTHLGLLWETSTPECINIGRGRPPWPSGGQASQGSSACKARFTAVPLALLGGPCRGV